jgi:hypothetical protein
VILPLTQQAAWGVVASDLLFGATPSTNTFTNNVYARVLPAQGCFNVNTRTYDANGFAHDTPPAIRQPQLPAAPGNPVCSTPIFEPNPNIPNAAGPCSNGLGDSGSASNCAFALSGSLCVGFGFNPRHPPGFGLGPQCDVLTHGVGGPYPVAPPTSSAQPASAGAAETQAGYQFLGYLLQ